MADSACTKLAATTLFQCVTQFECGEQHIAGSDCLSSTLHSISTVTPYRIPKKLEECHCLDGLLKKPKSSQPAHTQPIRQGYRLWSTNPLFSSAHSSNRHTITSINSTPTSSAHCVLQDKRHGQLLHKITYLRNCENSDISCIQTSVRRSRVLLVSLGTSSKGGFKLNQLVDGAIAQNCNARVHSVYGISGPAFDP